MIIGTRSARTLEKALFGAKENRTLAEQPKVKVYGKKTRESAIWLAQARWRTRRRRRTGKCSCTGCRRSKEDVRGETRWVRIGQEVESI